MELAEDDVTDENNEIDEEGIDMDLDWAEHELELE
jgi:hypothetical protein